MARKFPLYSFLLQAPQVTADLWGVGIQLGAVMGTMSDSLYALVRAPFGRGVTFRGPPASDLLSKAARYLMQPAVHTVGGDWFSYEDHWLLAAADAVAVNVISGFGPGSAIESRIDPFMAAPIVRGEPWHPATLAALADAGISLEGSYVAPFAGADVGYTFREWVEGSPQRFAAWLPKVREEFPASTQATVLANVFAETVENIYEFHNGGVQPLTAVFDPLEHALARCFEAGVFPPYEAQGEDIEYFATRAIDMAQAAGRDLPTGVELRAAAVEVWGSFSTV